MTLHVVLADPPREGQVLSDLVSTSPLAAPEAADLHAAMLKDTFDAVAGSGGDLLVNYPDDAGAEEELRALADDALDAPDAARFEVQVGSTPAARAGNAAEHLLREEGITSVALLGGTAPTLARTDLDGASMSLRRSEVVLGPAPGGRVCYLGLAEPIDFEDAYAYPAIETLAGRADAGGLDIDFLSMHPVVETGDDLATLVALLRARSAAGRHVPRFTAALVEALDLRAAEEDGERRVVRGPGPG